VLLVDTVSVEADVPFVVVLVVYSVPELVESPVVTELVVE